MSQGSLYKVRITQASGAYIMPNLGQDSTEGSKKAKDLASQVGITVDHWIEDGTYMAFLPERLGRIQDLKGGYWIIKVDAGFQFGVFGAWVIESAL